jgi:hypothetical protein
MTTSIFIRRCYVTFHVLRIVSNLVFSQGYQVLSFWKKILFWYTSMYNTKVLCLKYVARRHRVVCFERNILNFEMRISAWYRDTTQFHLVKGTEFARSMSYGQDGQHYLSEMGPIRSPLLHLTNANPIGIYNGLIGVSSYKAQRDRLPQGVTKRWRHACLIWPKHCSL